jgi:hypothetical protein
MDELTGVARTVEPINEISNCCLLIKVGLKESDLLIQGRPKTTDFEESSSIFLKLLEISSPLLCSEYFMLILQVRQKTFHTQTRFFTANP